MPENQDLDPINDLADCSDEVRDENDRLIGPDQAAEATRELERSQTPQFHGPSQDRSVKHRNAMREGAIWERRLLVAQLFWGEDMRQLAIVDEIESRLNQSVSLATVKNDVYEVKRWHKELSADYVEDARAEAVAKIEVLENEARYQYGAERRKPEPDQRLLTTWFGKLKESIIDKARLQGVTVDTKLGIQETYDAKGRQRQTVVISRF